MAEQQSLIEQQQMQSLAEAICERGKPPFIGVLTLAGVSAAKELSEQISPPPKIAIYNVNDPEDIARELKYLGVDLRRQGIVLTGPDPTYREVERAISFASDLGGVGLNLRFEPIAAPIHS